VRVTGRAATLPVSFFQRTADVVARELLGTTVVSTVDGARTAGRIVETEAYLGHVDPASHGFRHRRHAQNEALYGPAGTWYVYLSYGMHWCANLVCGVPGEASAVLLRALEPVDGLAVMRGRRGGVVDRELCAGPGKLCQALAITRDLDGAMMRRSHVRVRSREAGPAPSVSVTPRIGITKAADWPLRFLIEGSPWSSRRADSRPAAGAPEPIEAATRRRG
jgi:DNA-3-methyladenine glycosylase